MPETTPPAKLQVFLCHSSGDKEAVRALYGRLKAETWLHPWLDEEELLPGQSWRDEIEKAVEQSHIILVCLSPASITKEGYVQREIKIALSHAEYMPEGTIFIIPLKLEPCDLPRRLREWQSLDYFKAQGYDKLLKSLHYRAENIGMTFEVAPSRIAEVAPVQRQETPMSPPVQKETPIKPNSPSPQTEQERLLRELENINTTHQRRLEIGDRLSKIGDTREGVGVLSDGTPDIKWLLVNPGGIVEIESQKRYPTVLDCQISGDICPICRL